VLGSQQSAVVAGDRRRLIQRWHARFRDPALTVLLVLEICAIFLAVPLAAKGLPTAQLVADTLVLAVVAIVVMLSLRWNAIIFILLGLTAIVASLLINAETSPISVIVIRHGGDIMTFSALTWVVAHAVYAPGRITLRRLQGAIVMYLNFASIFAAAYGLIWELSPGAFANLVVQGGGPEEIGSMLYFSFTTLTTTGYGDIVAVDPFARSLANFESVLGQFFIAITVARLVTMELADRRR
jgi:voltage-gated potassium channel Kch